MYLLHPRRMPRIVSLALVLILLGLGLAAVSLWRLQTAAAGAHTTGEAVPIGRDAAWAPDPADFARLARVHPLH